MIAPYISADFVLSGLFWGERPELSVMLSVSLLSAFKWLMYNFGPLVAAPARHCDKQINSK